MFWRLRDLWGKGDVTDNLGSGSDHSAFSPGVEVLVSGGHECQYCAGFLSGDLERRRRLGV